MTMEKKTFKIGVYGTLRKYGSNHGLLAGSTFIGSFETDPVYSMYAIGGFPGVKKDGNTSLTVEVYEVDGPTFEKVDQLEGYNENSDNNNFYVRETMDSPYGEIFTYIYVPEITAETKIVTGNWIDFRTNQKVNNLVN